MTIELKSGQMASSTKPSAVSGVSGRLAKGMLICAVVSVLLDFMVHKHAFFPWENWPGFYIFFGSITVGIMVMAARYILRPLICKPDAETEGDNSRWR